MVGTYNQGFSGGSRQKSLDRPKQISKEISDVQRCYSQNDLYGESPNTEGTRLTLILGLQKNRVKQKFAGMYGVPY